ncbi:GIY-YIG nuclease family protein [Stenotrophomonas acidaminiphila]|uniref:GIY-YIG nuclease family protein n=1 Tax=Stenotrophomonas acidaminiphila TaxID=128780 RepID=UPI002ABE7C35|nr:GIY-YIG nuclease family protein [Stenotrophomonas acidaminiphila]WPU57050.1 GIY-YIG nuclease family protein [Stenotrophomonas acidaminiphila]
MSSQKNSYPSAVDIPSWYFESDLFSGCDVSEGGREPFLILHVEQPEEQLKFNLVCRWPVPKLGPDHMALWKVLRIQQELRGSERCFDISEGQIMRLLGHEVYSVEQRDHVIKLLRDMMNANLSGDGKWVTKGGAHRKLGLCSSLVFGNKRDDGIFSLMAGPDGGGFPAGLSTTSVPVSAVDIEVASQPPPPRPEPLWLPDEHIDPEPPTQYHRRRGPGFVYILTNPSMPGLIKIGKTRLNPIDRAAQLHTTGVPAGFQVEYACRTNDPEAVEQAMHVAFGPTRLSHKREFFQITPEQAIAVLSLHHQEEPIAA